MAVDDEQRVVDPHREPEHHTEDRRYRHHVHDAREGEGAERADPDAEQRRENREAGADQGPHDEEQDDRGDHEADQLASAEEVRDPLRDR